MKLTAGQVFGAHTALTIIINRAARENRKFSNVVNYRIARLHQALNSEAVTIGTHRVEIMKEVGFEEREVRDEKGNILPGQWQWVLPEDAKEKQKEWETRWGELSKEELDVACEPLLLANLVEVGVEGSDIGIITPGEYVDLGPLVVELAPNAT